MRLFLFMNWFNVSFHIAFQSKFFITMMTLVRLFFMDWCNVFFKMPFHAKSIITIRAFIGGLVLMNCVLVSLQMLFPRERSLNISKIFTLPNNYTRVKSLQDSWGAAFLYDWQPSLIFVRFTSNFLYCTCTRGLK